MIKTIIINIIILLLRWLVNIANKHKLIYSYILGTKITYEIYGRGKPIICIHGWLENKRVFRSSSYKNFLKEYKIIALDLPGFGGSDEANEINFEGIIKAFGPIKDVKVRFLDNNQAEATFTVTDKIWDYTSKPNKSVAVEIEKLSVDLLSLPNNIEKQVEKPLVSMVNNIMQKYESFSMEQLRFDNNGLYFKGTLPGTVSGAK